MRLLFPHNTKETFRTTKMRVRTIFCIEVSTASNFFSHTEREKRSLYYSRFIFMLTTLVFFVETLFYEKFPFDMYKCRISRFWYYL